MLKNATYDSTPVLKIDNYDLQNYKNVGFFTQNHDHKLLFEDHSVQFAIKKAKNLHAIVRLWKYSDFEKFKALKAHSPVSDNFWQLKVFKNDF